MRNRILYGFAAAFLLVWLILKGPFPLMMAVAMGCAFLAYLEYDSLFFEQVSRSRQVRMCSLIGLAMLVLLVGMHHAWILLWAPFFLVSFLHVLLANRYGDTRAEVKALSLEMLGFIYVVSLFGFLVPIAIRGEHGREFLLLLFFVVFMGDTAGYFIGKRWGKHRLASHLSPKKSLEGAAAALVGAFGISLVWLYFVYSGERTVEFRLALLTFVPLASVLAQVGDLLESLLKRSRARKDSGRFLPGHGGILDRIDGLALAAPMFYLFIFYGVENL